jgi:hypothetical protein
MAVTAHYRLPALSAQSSPLRFTVTPLLRMDDAKDMDKTEAVRYRER